MKYTKKQAESIEKQSHQHRFGRGGYCIDSFCLIVKPEEGGAAMIDKLDDKEIPDKLTDERIVEEVKGILDNQGSNCLQKPYNIHRNRLKTLAFYY